jgi:hypothetical protein
MSLAMDALADENIVIILSVADFIISKATFFVF